MTAALKACPNETQDATTVTPGQRWFNYGTHLSKQGFYLVAEVYADGRVRLTLSAAVGPQAPATVTVGMGALLAHWHCEEP